MEGRREKGEDLRDKKVGQSGGGGGNGRFYRPWTWKRRNLEMRHSLFLSRFSFPLISRPHAGPGN